MPYCVRAVSQCFKFPTHAKFALFKLYLPFAAVLVLVWGLDSVASEELVASTGKVIIITYKHTKL
jgi:hypothetical protein